MDIQRLDRMQSLCFNKSIKYARHTEVVPDRWDKTKFL
jgi:hypothetical protein